MNQFTFSDGRTGVMEHVDPSTNHKVAKVRASSHFVPVSLMYSVLYVGRIIEYP